MSKFSGAAVKKSINFCKFRFVWLILLNCTVFNGAYKHATASFESALGR